jgi:hypothetical protein
MITKESRQYLEAESLRHAKRVRGCEDLTGVVIKRSEKGAGEWHVDKFIPGLPPNEASAARLAARLASARRGIAHARGPHPRSHRGA